MVAILEGYDQHPAAREPTIRCEPSHVTCVVSHELEAFPAHNHGIMMGLLRASLFIFFYSIQCSFFLSYHC
jgi:hypothetical protein